MRSILVTRIEDNPEKRFEGFFESGEMDSLVLVDAEDGHEPNPEREDGDLQWMNELMNEWMNEWMNKWINEEVN